ncbi:17836_t:CDS:2, partial [Gigaspora rosea]
MNKQNYLKNNSQDHVTNPGWNHLSNMLYACFNGFNKYMAIDYSLWQSQNTNHKPMLIINLINSVISVKNDAMFDFVFCVESEEDPKEEVPEETKMQSSSKLTLISFNGLEEVGIYRVPGIAGS